jgi:hypothetical protein
VTLTEELSVPGTCQPAPHTTVPKIASAEMPSGQGESKKRRDRRNACATARPANGG